MAETFGLLLVQQGLISREELYAALRLQRTEGGLLGTCLLRLGVVRRGALLQALARHLQIPPAPPSRVLRPDSSLAAIFDPAHLRGMSAVPYARGPRGLFVAFANPRMLPMLAHLTAEGGEVFLRVATELDVEAGLESLLGGKAGLGGRESPEPEPGELPAADAAALGQGAVSAPPPTILSVGADDTARFWNSDEVEFSRATGFDEAQTAVVRLDDLVERERQSREAERVRRDMAEESRASAREVDAVASLPPEERFRDDAEVEFAKATGFDREATAIFSLDDLAADARAQGISFPSPPVDAPSPAAFEDDALPAPHDAPRLAEAAESLFEAANEGVLARTLVKFYAAYFPRVLLLARHGAVLRGVLARGLDLSGPEVARLRVPVAGFERLFRGSLGYYGPPPGGRELEPLYEALGDLAVHALVVPIDCRSEPAWLVYADHALNLDKYDDVHDLEMMAKEAAIALDLLRESGGPREATF